MSTERRAGYRKVWMNDPSMSFRTNLLRIGLRRTSGGHVQFILTETAPGPIIYERVDIDTEEKFDKLWNFLMELK